jgi:hypothetical protein
MDEAKWERWGALAGVVFIVLVIVGALICGSPPKPSDSAAKIVKYFKDNQGSLKVGSYLSGVATIPFLWFLGTLFGRLRRAEGGAGRVSGIALTGGVATVAIAMVGNGIGAYSALHPEGSVGSFQISTILFGYVGFAIAVLVAATSVVVLRSSFLPSWFGWAGTALAVAWLVGAAAVSTESDAISTIGFVVLLVWAAWILALSVLLYRAPQTATS